jgi:hypothetical protein
MTTKALVAVYYLDVGLDVMPRRSDPNKNSTIVAVLSTTVSSSGKIFLLDREKSEILDRFRAQKTSNFEDRI